MTEEHTPNPQRAPAETPPTSATGLTEKERKNLFVYVTAGILLLEFAVTVGAVVYSIANADRSASGFVRFNFPWLGYLVTVTLVPVLVMLVLHLVSLGFSRTLGADTPGGYAEEALSGRMGTFYAMVRGAPAIILFAGFVLLGAAVYYLDGVMELLLKLGDSFETVAIWIVGALAVAFCINAVARAVFTYKAKQMEAEYAFRREVLERTGTVLLDARYAPVAEVRQLEATPSGAVRTGALPAGSSQADAEETEDAVIVANERTCADDATCAKSVCPKP